MVTMKDIANITGVDVSTVSRALRGMTGVSEQKRQEILDAIEELGYVPDLSARTLVGKKSGIIGLIAPEIDSNYYVKIVNSVNTALQSFGYSMLILTTNFNPKSEIEAIRLLSGRKADGIILLSARADIKMELKHFKCPPIVLIDPIKVQTGLDVVSINPERGLTEAVGHLYKMGHRDFGFLGDDLSITSRYPCFRNAISHFGMKFDERYFFSGEERFEHGGFLRMKDMLDSGLKLPTAIFCSYDNIALGAIKHCQSKGIKVPGDISFVGYDNIRESEYLMIALTTVSLPINEIGNTAITMLNERIDGSSSDVCRHTSFETKLVVRETTVSL